MKQATTSSTAQPVRCTCPRCAYDLAGESARWNSEGTTGDATEGLVCPLVGTCPECGLRFAWALLFRPELTQLRWFVEYQQGGAHPLAPHRFRAVRTWLYALLPWLFWRHVSLEMPHHPTRRAWWLAFVLLLAPATLVMIHVAWVGMYTLVAPQTPTYLFPFSPSHNAFASQGHALAEVWDSVPRSLLPPRWLPWLTIFLVGFVLYPFTLLCLPWTRAKSKVQSRHVYRAWVYSIAPLLGTIALSCGARVIRAVHVPVFPLYGSSGQEKWYDPFRANLYDAAFTRLDRIDFWLIPTLAVWQTLWWLCALRSGFRMSDWKRVLLAIAAPSLIAQVLMALMVPLASV